MSERLPDPLARGLATLPAGSAMVGRVRRRHRRRGLGQAAGPAAIVAGIAGIVGIAGIAGGFAAITRRMNGGRSREITKTLTINRVPADVKDLWRHWLDSQPQLRELGENLMVDFDVAPGDRGTEVAVRVTTAKIGADHLLDDTLRRFKQVVETGEVVRSDGAPDGKHAFAQFPQHPARPLTTAELAEVGA